MVILVNVDKTKGVEEKGLAWVFCIQKGLSVFSPELNVSLFYPALLVDRAVLQMNRKNDWLMDKKTVMQWLSDQENSAAIDGWSKMWGREIDGKAKSETDKGLLCARLIHYDVVREGFFCEKKCILKWKGGGRVSFLGHEVCIRSGQRCWWKYSAWSTRIHTQIGPDMCLYAVTFYLSFLFIIVRQSKRQTGKGYDVNDQEFVATKWSGNITSGGHFSCG